ncbi:MAG: F0F1 ATP synthase subunit B [Nitrospiraceae bacterium]|nr:F0F1 ATP synthase subunit B [Nitrospiraceae bacterium]
MKKLKVSLFFRASLLFWAPLLFWAWFVPVQAALAAGSPEAGGQWKEWLWKIINFVILVGVLAYFAKKPLADYLKARTAAIAKGIEDARVAREAAEKALKEVEERLRLKDKELEEILRTATKSGEAEREALIKESERMSQKIAEHADAYVSFELNKAKDAIRKEAAELAVELAAKKLPRKVTPEVQKKLIEDAISQLEAKS